MKMKVIDRILLGAYAFLSALALIALLICVISPGMTAVLLNLGFTSRIVFCILLAALITGAIYLIMLSFQPEGSAPSSSASVQESSEGSVRVSVRAMETLARRAIDGTDGVLDSKLRIINHEDSIRVEVDITIGIETHVPAVTALLQRNVKGVVEEFSGIAVREVVVLVTEIRNNAPAALPAPKDEAAQQVVIVPEQVEHTVEPAEAETAAAPIDEEANGEADGIIIGEADEASAGAAAEAEAEEAGEAIGGEDAEIPACGISEEPESEPEEGENEPVCGNSPDEKENQAAQA